MTDVRSQSGGKQYQEAQNPLLAACQRIFSSAWKSFSYDHHETIQLIRQEVAHCAASLMLCCFFCLACGVSLSITENGYEGGLATAGDSSAQDVKNQVLLLEKSAVDELWSAASDLQEEDWKALAQETFRKVNEESAVLQGFEPEEVEEPVDWGFMNSFVYMLTVTTSIGYGHISPRTNAGKALTIVYAILGIPIFLILMADFGKLFTRLLKSLFVFVRKLYRTATCRRVRKTRAVQSVKPPSTPSPTPPLAVPESTSTDFEKHEEDDQGQLREREPFLSEERRRNERRKEDKGEEDEGGDDVREKTTGGACCCSSWKRKVSEWCSSLCRRKKAPEPPTPESEEEEDLVIDDNFNLPITLALLILLLYIMCGCFIYTMWENWTYFEAFYFIFISMTTIGFGDYVPKHPAFMMMTTVYLVFGLALTAMCINIIQEKLTDTFRHASVKLKESFGYIMAATSQGEEAALPEGKEVEIAEVHGSQKAKAGANADTVTVKKET